MHLYFNGMLPFCCQVVSKALYHDALCILQKGHCEHFCILRSYIHKLVGLLSIKPIGQAEGIRSSFFVQFTHQLVEADVDFIGGFVVVQSLGNMDGDIIQVRKKSNKYLW